MLDRVRIRNFQSLADVDLELGRLTVIVGRSNSGKSAIRRAIEGAVTNAPATGRLRTGETSMGVELTTEAGRVTWSKGAKINAYRVEAAEVEPLHQDKPGSTITPEAQAILRLSPDNFVDQFDPPYLLTAGPAQVAKTLGELTNITVLFDAIREAGRRSKARTAAGKTLATQLEAAESRLAAFSDLPEAAAALHTQAELLAAAKAAEQGYAHAYQQHDLARTARDRVTAAGETLADTPDPTLALAVLEQAADLATHATRLNDHAIEATRWAAIAAYPLPPAPPDIEPLAELATHARSMASYLGKARQAMATHAHEANNVDVAQAEVDNAMAELATFDTCPLCGTAGIHLEATP